MNIVRRAAAADATTGDAVPWRHVCTLGRCWTGDAVMGDALWCRHLVATRGALERNQGVARARLRTAARGTVMEFIVVYYG